jgi:hypothetical protein
MPVGRILEKIMTIEFNIEKTIGTYATNTASLYNKLAAATDPVVVAQLGAMLNLQSNMLESVRKATEESAHALVGKV